VKYLFKNRRASEMSEANYPRKLNYTSLIAVDPRVEGIWTNKPRHADVTIFGARHDRSWANSSPFGIRASWCTWHAK